MMPSPGCHGAGMYELRSGMARMSGDDGVCPIGPAAKPANPAPAASRPSMAETGTILAQGLPCMSTNMAKRNSTPSRRVASDSSAAFVIEVAARSSVLVKAGHLPGVGFVSVALCQRCCPTGNDGWLLDRFAVLRAG